MNFLACALCPYQKEKLLYDGPIYVLDGSSLCQVHYQDVINKADYIWRAAADGRLHIEATINGLIKKRDELK